MVQSGLVEDPKVNPVRLTAHLGLALAIFSAELWLALQLASRRIAPFDALALALPFVIFAMALSGGMVAGLRAGSAYQTFPLMNGQLVHRAFFWLLLVLVPLAWWRMRHTPAAHALLAAFALQAVLGISTLLMGVPVALGAAHQGGAVLLLGAALWNAHSGGVWPARRQVHAAA
jgi:cytochrome c oxidase assembly protein subunit 15